MMKKKLLMIVCGLILVLGSLKLSEELFGFDILPEMPAMTPRQKQLQYLKEHEQEIIDFVKAQNPKIESVQIDWEDVRFNKPGMFTPGGSVGIYGGFNNIKNSGWGLLIPVDNGKINLKSMFLSDDFDIEGKLYE